ncbi:DUF3489 domain-containing protein [Elioraea tepidiphila]|jgi:hypothetical protein|uniref:DUF3489 domain-containing protein n=1 Tax=Elioraea tepidiphila TaxID=457934 RepID=UPI002FDA473D
MTLSDTHLMVLSAAAGREDKLVTKHKRLPGASLQKVCAALVKRGLLAELTGVSPDPDVLHVKTELGMTEYAITPSGLAAIGVDDESPYGDDVPKDVRVGVDPFLIEGPDNNPPDDATVAPTGAEDAPAATTSAADGTARPTATTAPTRAGLRDAAQAVLEAWDDEENRETDIVGALDGPMAALRAALAGTTRTRREPGAPRTPRAGTKQEAVLALLRRTEGATITQIIDATGWQSHTVRGFLAGLKRKGITVEVLERVRQVGPNKDGAKGSYSVYRIT